MCLNPISIPNQSKFVSLRHHDRFMMQVPCGCCSECQTTLGNQWYFRAWYEWNELIQAKGYVLFDTLTYNNDSLPHLSDTWSVLPKNFDFPCFDYQHIRNFLQLLRTRLIRAGYSKQAFRYFISSEYGTSESYNGRLCTHRPHYHLLLYVYDDIDPIFLSRLISDIWKFGRTDGVRYKGSRYVINHNYIPYSSLLAQKLRTIKYVTKYVQKTCVFQKELNKRIAIVMHRLAEIADPVTPEKWLESELAHREKLKLLRYVNQFHRQSQHFGESALGDIDLEQITCDGCLYMPDCNHVKIPVPIPTYYKRKMFYEQVSVGGSRYWQINELGIEYNNRRAEQNLKRLTDRYSCIIRQFNLGFDAFTLADYVLNQRGFINSSKPMSTLLERVQDVDLFNYSTCSDKLQFGCRGLSLDWLGDSQQGYVCTHMVDRITLQAFINRYVFFNPDLEKQLDTIIAKMRLSNNGKQSSFELKQRLNNAFKIFK